MKHSMHEWLTRSDRIGKKLGAWSSTPKYFCARLPSKEPYVCFAGRVHGGLFPITQFQSELTLQSLSDVGEHTASNVDAAPDLVDVSL